MRALAQGLDERASWDRYLRLEGEHSDLRTVRKTIAWIRDEFAAAAIRKHKPGTARLILFDPDRFAAAPVLPSLQEFAEANGMEDFSEAEQVEAYEDAFPQSSRTSARGTAGVDSRRGRLIQRQLDALRWLQATVAQDPSPGDSVDAWLNPSQARRLRRAGVTTLAGLVERINSVGSRWWVQVPGVGPLKASRIQEWLQANAEALGLNIGRHVGQPIRTLSQATLASVVPAATAIRPLEKFVVPEHLDGRAGRYRAPLDQCCLKVLSDHEAIQQWLATKQSVGASAHALSSTQRAYRKEVERLLLWAILVRKAALSSLTADDMAAYAAFLAEPPVSWCGPRHQQRWSPLWRPLEGPLQPPALRHALGILRSLFGFLMENGYVTHNPVAMIAATAPQQLSKRAPRALTARHWEHVDAVLQRQASTVSGRRLRRAIRWIYATGLRLAEISSLKCEDFVEVTRSGGDDTVTSSWVVTVGGRGGRKRQVPVPVALVSEYGDELALHGFDGHVSAAGNHGIHLLARFDSGSRRPAPLSASSLYQTSKAFFAEAAAGLDPADAAELKKASTQWIRHAPIAHAPSGNARSLRHALAQNDHD